MPTPLPAGLPSTQTPAQWLMLIQVFQEWRQRGLGPRWLCPSCLIELVLNPEVSLQRDVHGLVLFCDCGWLGWWDLHQLDRLYRALFQVQARMQRHV